jgi:hypothetical protein
VPCKQAALCFLTFISFSSRKQIHFIFGRVKHYKLYEIITLGFCWFFRSGTFLKAALSNNIRESRVKLSARRGEMSALCPGCFSPKASAKVPTEVWICGPQNHFGRSEEEKSLYSPPRIESNFLYRTSRG